MPLTFSESNETQIEAIISSDNCKEIKLESELMSTSENNQNKINSLNFNNSKNKDNMSVVEKALESKVSQVYISEDIEEDSIIETSALKQDSEPSTLETSTITDNYLTVSGTIKRGKKKAQNVEVVLNMSREELEILEANITNKKGCQCSTGKGVGFHIFLWSFICLPFSAIISGIYSFYMGTITWYNVFTLFSEKEQLGYKILIPPFLIVLYPFLIITVSLGIGLYAGFKQLSCCWDLWLKEFTDYEKGFYGWLCNSLDVPECSPYDVVILSSIQKP